MAEDMTARMMAMDAAKKCGGSGGETYSKAEIDAKLDAIEETQERITKTTPHTITATLTTTAKGNIVTDLASDERVVIAMYTKTRVIESGDSNAIVITPYVSTSSGTWCGHCRLADSDEKIASSTKIEVTIVYQETSAESQRSAQNITNVTTKRSESE